MSENSALGGIAITADSIPRLWRPKLASVEPGSVDAYYMLATYCFVIARKLEYFYKATREFALKADPALAAEIKRDNEAIHAILASGPEWKAAAEKAEEQMIRLCREIGKEHEELLTQVASEAPQETPSDPILESVSAPVTR
jgi:hypothetical protein